MPTLVFPITERLIIYDLTGTLVSGFKDTELLPGRKEKIQQLLDMGKFVAIATNEGGVGTRLYAEEYGWKNPERYPTAKEAMERFHTVLSNLDIARQLITGQFLLFYSFAWQDRAGNWVKPPGEQEQLPCWRQDWRKPAPGMIYAAMERTGVTRSETLLVGDAGPEDERKEDWEAAQAAGVTFEHANGHFATLDGVIPL
jgi:histidinol phosphatase-like enzyme